MLAKINGLMPPGASNNDEVVKLVKSRNKTHDVHVFTYLYGTQDDESAVKMMKDIATESGGKYKNITE